MTPGTNAKSSAAKGRLLARLTSVVRLRLLRAALARRDHGPVSVPASLSSVRRALMVMPEDPLESLHALTTVLSLQQRMPQAHTVCVCVDAVAPFLAGMRGSVQVATYHQETKRGLPRSFVTWCRNLSREEFDCALLLEQRPDPALKYLMGRTRAPLRAGFAGAAPFPFLNVRLRGDDVPRYRAEVYGAIGRVFGVGLRVGGRWVVSEKARAEVSMMLREQGVPPHPAVSGIDGDTLVSRLGREWTGLLAAALNKRQGRSWYVYAPGCGAEDRRWWAERGFPALVGELSASHCAALIDCSACIVSGRSVFFELANRLRTPAVGVFDQDEMTAYCAPEPHVRGIAYARQPDAATVQLVAAAIDAVGARRSGGALTPSGVR